MYLWHSSTISQYIEYIKDAFLVEEAMSYDVKGRKYIGTETKYYFTDIGIRGSILNFRQQEESHIMENIIYTELRRRRYSVDVGRIEYRDVTHDGKRDRKLLEVDFVVNNPPERYYIQSVLYIPSAEKENQEHRPLLAIDDHFRKIIITADNIHRKQDEKGILTISLMDFLLDYQLGSEHIL